ncbi:uncharacterized protein N7496_008544 [Penicillium cataractarum]|uniref:Zn(2)-C6 fungal-type domain-containing protein n=1 Tax=Penicillium cataractarum TaxID=2100454 RepID=A0A9W9V5V0_9EURO|nr:uncharacterized protein N7496_008544 [Penicillium cataractarum]KAJ5368784.1 hypothetical protein N7496_008544 [Penicillium cataractarum]
MIKPCWTCRRRTIQCDQSGFPCSKCEKAGLECHDKRPLRWVEGVAIRGKLRGHVFKAPSEAPQGPQVARSDEKQVSLISEKRLRILHTPPYAMQDPRIHNMDRLSKYYIDYYNQRICKLYILFDSDSNPFRNLLSFSLEDLALQKSIVAIAARHFANTGRSFDTTDAVVPSRFVHANMDALLFKKQTIEALSSSLSDVGSRRTEVTMATILLLIFLDILESGIDGWDSHLQGARGLLTLNQSLVKCTPKSDKKIDTGDTVRETRKFITEQLLLIETLGSALSGPRIVSEAFVGDNGMKHQESIVRSFLGCPGFLLRAVQFFSDQRSLITEFRRRQETSNISILQDTLAMLDLTGRFDCLEWAADLQRCAASSIEVTKLCMLSQAYKTATLLYGTRVLNALTAATSNNEELVSQLLGLIETLQNDAILFKCLLWPTFIAGLDCWAENQQAFVMKLLRALWDSTSCLNVIGASNILRDHWRREEMPETLMHEISDVDGIGRGWLLI